MEADRKKKANSTQRLHEHAQEVRKQVRKKEEEKINARRDFFEEGRKLDQEAKDRYSSALYRLIVATSFLNGRDFIYISSVSLM